MSGLIAAYVLVAVLLLSINLYSNWPWQVKAGTIVVTTAFYIVSYISIPPLLGWPTRDYPPGKFRLIATHVQQPDKLTGDKGAIYIWLTRIEDLESADPPRAYKLPYSAALHETIINANAKLNKGMPQMGEFRKPDNPNVAVITDPSQIGQKSLDIHFYDLPDPLYPDK